jgi:hypothetical protein
VPGNDILDFEARSEYVFRMKPAQLAPRFPRHVFVCTVIVLLIGSTLALHYGLNKPQGPPTWDGAEHSLYGLQIYNAATLSDAQAFRTATTSQNLWPFLHSWVLAFAFFITGPSFSTARFLSLVFWIRTLLATMKIAAAASQQQVVRTAMMIALVLYLTSPMMMLYAVQPMLEMQGAFLTMLTLIAAAGTGKKSRLAAGVLLAITFFTKYVYAQFLLIALAIDHLFNIVSAVRSGSETRKVLIGGFKTAILLFGPVIICASAWFMRQEARAGYMAAVSNPRTTDYSVLSPVNLIIYPVLLIVYYFATPVTGIPSLITCFRQPLKSRTRQLGVIYIFVTITMLTVYWYKLTRAIFTAAPVIFALAAAWPAEMVHSTPAGATRNKRFAQIVSVIVLLHLPMAFLPGLMLRLHPAMRHEAVHMLQFEPDLYGSLKTVAESAGDSGPITFVGDFHAVSAPLVRWVFLRHAAASAGKPFALLNWSRPMEHIPLVSLMETAGAEIVIIIRVKPGSRFDTSDYRNNFAWTVRNLDPTDFDNRLKKMVSVLYDDSISFELWHTIKE